jgi:transcriptional regulator with XRE-family HTH domain
MSYKNYTQKEIASIVNIDQQTLSNWKKTRPELFRLLQLGVENDTLYMQFFNLFGVTPKGKSYFFSLHNFYLDFYFRFLNFCRQEFTAKNPMLIGWKNPNLTSIFIYYLIQKGGNLNNLIDPSLETTDRDLGNFNRKNFLNPLIGITDELSKYILRNTLDDFETLLKDTLYKNKDLFFDALEIALYYLSYKFEPYDNYYERGINIAEIFKQTFNINYFEIDKNDLDLEKTFKIFLDYRKTLYLDNEIPSKEIETCLNNDFYVPDFLKKLFTS